MKAYKIKSVAVVFLIAIAKTVPAENKTGAQQSGSGFERRRPGAQMRKKQTCEGPAFFEPCGGISDDGTL